MRLERSGDGDGDGDIGYVGGGEKTWEKKKKKKCMVCMDARKERKKNKKYNQMLPKYFTINFK